MDWHFNENQFDYTGLKTSGYLCHWVILHPDLEPFYDVIYDGSGQFPKLVPKNRSIKTGKLGNGQSNFPYGDNFYVSCGSVGSSGDMVLFKRSYATPSPAFSYLSQPLNQYSNIRKNPITEPDLPTLVGTASLDSTPSIEVIEGAPLEDQRRICLFRPWGANIGTNTPYPSTVYSPDKEHRGADVIYRKSTSHIVKNLNYKKYSFDNNDLKSDIHSGQPKKRSIKKANGETWKTGDFIYLNTEGKFTNTKSNLNTLVGQYNGPLNITDERNVIIDYDYQLHLSSEKKTATTGFIGRAKTVKTTENNINSIFNNNLEAYSVNISGNLYTNLYDSDGRGGVWNADFFAIDGVNPATVEIGGSRYTNLNVEQDNITNTNDWAKIYMGTPNVSFSDMDKFSTESYLTFGNQISWTKKISETPSRRFGVTYNFGRYVITFVHTAGEDSVWNQPQWQDTPLCVPLSHYTPPMHWDDNDILENENLVVIWSNTGGQLYSSDTAGKGIISHYRDPRLVSYYGFAYGMNEKNTRWCPVCISDGTYFGMSGIHTSQVGTNTMFHPGENIKHSIDSFSSPGATPPLVTSMEKLSLSQWWNPNYLPVSGGHYGVYLGSGGLEIYSAMGSFPVKDIYSPTPPYELIATEWHQPTPYFRVFKRGDVKSTDPLIPDTDIYGKEIIVNWTPMTNVYLLEGDTTPTAEYGTWGGIWKATLNPKDFADIDEFESVFVEINWTVDGDSPAFGNNSASTSTFNWGGPQVGWYPFCVPKHFRHNDSITYPGIVSDKTKISITEQAHTFIPTDLSISGSISGGNLFINSVASNFITFDVIGSDVSRLDGNSRYARVIKELTITDYDSGDIYNTYTDNWFNFNDIGGTEIINANDILYFNYEEYPTPRYYLASGATQIYSIKKNRRIQININHINPYHIPSLPNLVHYRNWFETFVVDIDGQIKKHWYDTREGRTYIINNKLLGEP